MRPCNGEKGEKGVGFEGHAEIGALVAGLELMIDMVGDPRNAAIEEATVMTRFGRDILQVHGDLMSDPRIRTAMGGDDTPVPSIEFDITDPHQLQLANYGLQVAEQCHTDPLICSVAATTHTEFLQITGGMAD